MKRSEKRILTTHVGSLIRPPELLDFLRAKRNREAYDEAAYQGCLAATVAEVVHRQAETGVDVVSDGEFGKSISWSQYVLERLSGFESRPSATGHDPYAYGADRARFREFYEELDARDGGARGGDAVCVGPITYTGQAELQRDIDNFKAALGRVKVEEGFLPVAAPASAIPDRKNEYYKSEEDMVHAIAEAMRTEYQMIVDAGLIVQVDDARAAVTYDRQVPPKTFAQYRDWVAMHMDALNHALEGIPEDRIRYHVCWGSWPGPHTTDVPLKDIVDLILRVKAGAYVIEGANPRHEHEWEVWKKVKLPKGRVLIPGVISHATNVVEHPELIAQRLVRYAEVVGRENVIASTDCGFAQGPFMRRVHPSIMWAKLEALVAGARLASKTLWGGGARKPAAKPAKKAAARKTVRVKAPARAGRARPAKASPGRRRTAASRRRAR
ncbi:MAG TPA: cobalamin-independent methionine synthase II family protein [Stellaceae bacterium]|nr:cobalamin-independent methionine synthase II family protein [Stellaceae bacterium]